MYLSLSLNTDYRSLISQNAFLHVKYVCTNTLNSHKQKDKKIMIYLFKVLFTKPEDITVIY